MKSPIHWKERLHQAGILEKSFATSPADYWKYALGLLVIIALSGLAFDGFIFWRFAWKSEAPANLDSLVHVASLDQPTFDTVLATLNKKAASFDAPETNLPARDPFASPTITPPAKPK